MQLLKSMAISLVLFIAAIIQPINWKYLISHIDRPSLSPIIVNHLLSIGLIDSSKVNWIFRRSATGIAWHFITAGIIARPIQLHCIVPDPTIYSTTTHYCRNRASITNGYAMAYIRRSKMMFGNKLRKRPLVGSSSDQYSLSVYIWLNMHIFREREIRVIMNVFFEWH